MNFDMVNWKVQQATALHQFNTRDPQRILKFMHNWLPTGNRLHKEHATNSPKCPLCKNDNEDNLHMFHCMHPDQVKIQQDLWLILAQQQHSKEMPELAQIMEWSLASCSDKENWYINPQHFPEDLHKAIAEQNAIGWQQIFYGHMSLEFKAAQERHYRWINAPEMTHNGSRWSSLFIQQIWKTTFALWKNRKQAGHNNNSNNNNNNNNAHTAQANLISLAKCSYADAHWLMATDRAKLFQKNIRRMHTKQHVAFTGMG
jgi:hypothetical protein